LHCASRCFQQESLGSISPDSEPPAFFAELYRKNNLTGGHVIKLGPGNDDAAKEALQAWPGLICSLERNRRVAEIAPGGLQIGGGIDDKNAQYWLECGAEKVAFRPNGANCIDLIQRS
jgi:phosphoribosylformimino-5-aminoimidazole carboxamide ribotide isomerase